MNEKTKRKNKKKKPPNPPKNRRQSTVEAAFNAALSAANVDLVLWLVTQVPRLLLCFFFCCSFYFFLLLLFVVSVCLVLVCFVFAAKTWTWCCGW